MPWLPFGGLIGIVVVAPFLGILLTRAPRLTLMLAVLPLLAVLGFTLSPDGDPSSSMGCSVGLPYLAPTAVESIANILLFVPVTFLVGLRWARPLSAIILGSALSAMIEATQGLVVSIGRACDTSDWVTNTIGAAIGGLLAIATLVLAQRREGAASDRLNNAAPRRNVR